MSLPQLKKAIHDRRLIEFHYKGRVRVVEPYTVGQSNDKLTLRAWHLRGFSESGSHPRWRKFLGTEIRSLKILDETFDGPRPGYNPQDSEMDLIYATY